jgi:hypothetical protein
LFFVSAFLASASSGFSSFVAILLHGKSRIGA